MDKTLILGKVNLTERIEITLLPRINVNSVSKPRPCVSQVQW